MKYVKVRLSFRRLPDRNIRVEVWVGTHFWRSWTIPEDEDFASLLCLVAEIDRRLDAKFYYFEGPFLPEMISTTEAIRRGITLGPKPS